jgi:hypothetical protein
MRKLAADSCAHLPAASKARSVHGPRRVALCAAIVFGAIPLAATVLTLATCAGNGSGKASGIHGIVLFEGGPAMVNPSPLPGGFGPGLQGRPYRSATIEVIARSGAHAGHVVAQVKPDASALFAVALPPGRYELEALFTKGGPMPRPTTVMVTPGAYTRALVYVEGR